MSTEQTIVSYTTSGTSNTNPGVICLTDLKSAKDSPITTRVGLGRLLSLPYLLQTPITLAVTSADDLDDPRDQQLVAWLLSFTDSVLTVGDRKVTPNKSRYPLGPLLKEISILDASWISSVKPGGPRDDGLARPNLIHKLIHRVELTPKETAALLNTCQEVWPSRGKSGHTPQTLASSLRTAEPSAAPSLGRWWMPDSPRYEPETLTSLVAMAIAFRLRYTFGTTDERLPADELSVRTIVLDYVGELGDDKMRQILADTDSNTIQDVRFVLDVVTGAFLLPNRAHLPRDLAAALAFIKGQPGFGSPGFDRLAARALNKAGYLPKAKSGRWHAPAVNDLINKSSATPNDTEGQ